MGTLGLGLGSIFGSRDIRNNGNLNLSKVFYKHIFVSMLAVALKFVPNLYAIIVGRLIHAFSLGVLSICF